MRTALLRQVGRGLRSPIGLAILCLLFSPLVSVLEQAVVVALGLLLQAAAASHLFARLMTGVGIDPVYAAVLAQGMGNVQVRGLAVAGPVGHILHHLVPALFASPRHVLAGAWTSALVTDGVSLLASAIVTIGARVIFILGGLFLLAAALRARRRRRRAPCWALVVLGLLLQAEGVLGLIGVRYTADDLETMGLSSVFTKVLALNAASYRSMVVEPLHVVGPILVPICLLGVIYGTVAAVGFVAARASRGLAAFSLRSATRRLVCVPSLLTRRSAHGHLRPALLVLAVVTSVLLSQRLFPAQANYDYPPAGQSASGSAGLVASVEPIAVPSSTPTPAPTPVGPSKVVIVGSSYNFRYLVNGRRVELHGVGYNAMYTKLSIKERAAQYDRDFALMRAAGINTFLGWGPEKYDALTLTKAQEHGLGVVMPYYLSAYGAYADPQYDNQVEQDVLRWVQRYRGYPALRMWGIGNEVIHGMNKGADSPEARAFARFYVRLIDAVHALDPNHPVTYRDAEDLYVAPMASALQNKPRPRPWFVYGVNYYTPRICDTLRNWPQYGMGVPLMVSEFAPAGVSRDDRPNGFAHMWSCIVQHPRWVLGGFAYVWTTAGPEPIDRSLGLVDADGIPTDGSLSTLARLFGGQAASGR